MKTALALVFVCLSALSGTTARTSSTAPLTDGAAPLAWGSCPTGQSLCLNGCQPPPKCLRAQ